MGESYVCTQAGTKFAWIEASIAGRAVAGDSGGSDNGIALIGSIVEGRDWATAGSLADAVRIYEAAEHFKVPVFSSSSLRYTDGAQAIRGGKVGRHQQMQRFFRLRSAALFVDRRRVVKKRDPRVNLREARAGEREFGIERNRLFEKALSFLHARGRRGRTT